MPSAYGVVVTAGIFSEKAASPAPYCIGGEMLDRLWRRQKSHMPNATARAIHTAPTAMPVFTPVESDEDGDDNSVVLEEVPVGVLKVLVPEAKPSVHGTVPDTKKEYSNGRDMMEGANVCTTGADLETEAKSLVACATDIVGFIAIPIELVAKPGTATTELTAIMQSVCQ